MNKRIKQMRISRKVKILLLLLISPVGWDTLKSKVVIYSLDNGLKIFFLYINAYIQNPKLHINELFHILYMYDSTTSPHLTVQNGIKMK